MGQLGRSAQQKFLPSLPTSAEMKRRRQRNANAGTPVPSRTPSCPDLHTSRPPKIRPPMQAGLVGVVRMTAATIAAPEFAASSPSATGAIAACYSSAGCAPAALSNLVVIGNSQLGTWPQRERRRRDDWRSSSGADGGCRKFGTGATPAPRSSAPPACISSRRTLPHFLRQELGRVALSTMSDRSFRQRSEDALGDKCGPILPSSGAETIRADPPVRLPPRAAAERFCAAAGALRDCPWSAARRGRARERGRCRAVICTCVAKPTMPVNRTQRNFHRANLFATGPQPV